MHQGSPHFHSYSTSTSPATVPGRATEAVAAALRTTTSPSVPPAQLFKLSRRTNSLLGVQIIGCASHLPERVVTNQELEERYGFEPGWIEQRSGILTRRHVAEHEATSDLCAEAARKAIRTARVDPADIDLVLVGTFTPDYLCPSTACLVQEKLGLDAAAVDLQAACAGFMYALVTGAQYVATGNAKVALVIGGDTNSRIVNPYDQRTAPLFGDGAGAVLLAPGEPHQGLICYQMGSDGSGGKLLDRPSGGSKNPIGPAALAEGSHYLQMDGRSVFRWAVRAVTDTIELVLQKSGLGPNDVALYVLHQANIRIINYAMEQLGVSPDRVYNNLEQYGNTSAGSIPIALDEAFRAGRINRGDTLLLSGFGGGLTWGTALFRW